MALFTNVDIDKEANIYFDGKVTSRTIIFPDGTKKTLGIMQPGEYEFGTEQTEVMEVSSGKLKVLLDGDVNWKTVSRGMFFEVAANSKFKLQVSEITDYCCSYLD